MNTFEIKSFYEKLGVLSRTIGSYLLRVANLNAKAMFLNIPKTKQAAILCIKIKRLTFQKNIKDKAQMMAFYRKN
jgi:hypothetical protein